MCGIIAYISKNQSGNSGKQIMEQYEDQHSRGTQGFGFMEIYKQKMIIHRATEPLKALIDMKMSTAPIQILHHRMPTSTENKIQQTHPIFVSHPELKHNYYIIHNGVITNDIKLYNKHTEELGYEYTTIEEAPEPKYSYGYSYKQKIEKGEKKYRFNDSEALAIEVARHIEGLTDEIEAIGSAAFIAVKVDKRTNRVLEISYGRNSNPIEVQETKDGILIASSIYSSEAHMIEPRVMVTLDVQKILRQTKPIGSFEKFTRINTVKFAEEKREPVAINKDDLGLPEAKKSGTKNNDTTITTKKEEDDKVDETDPYADPYYEGMTPREIAFFKMSTKISEQFEEEMYDLFQELATDPVKETRVDDILETIRERIMEKIDNANKRVRPFYDRQEEKELENQLDQFDKEEQGVTVRKLTDEDYNYDD